jgi:hypothetical protein
MDWLLLLVLLVAGVMRWWAVARSDLPTGDELNVYIADAQAFARSGRIPPLSQHPAVALV